MWAIVRSVLARLRSCLGRAQREREMQSEIDNHIGLLTERNIRAGMTASEARLTARRQFGNRALLLEQLADMDGVGPRAAWMELAHAARGLWSGKATTALVFCILSVTLAAGVVTFSVVDALALRPLPYATPDQLVAVARLPRPDGDLEATSPQDFFALREGMQSFQGLAAAAEAGAVRVESGAAAADLMTARATRDSSLSTMLTIQNAGPPGPTARVNLITRS